MQIIDKKLYYKIVEDFMNRIKSVDKVLLDNDIGEDERVAKLKETIDMLEMINNNIYMLEDRDEPIDLSLPADNNEPFGLGTMKDYLKSYYFDMKKIRDIYFQYWLLVNNDKYLEPILEYTTMKIGFLFNCLYRDEEAEYITVDGIQYHKSYFFIGPAGSDIITRLKFLVTTFRTIYEKFSTIIRKYAVNPRYINVSKYKLLTAPAFLGDDDTMNEEFIMGNLLELLDNFFYIRAILMKKGKIYQKKLEEKMKKGYPEEQIDQELSEEIINEEYEEYEEYQEDAIFRLLIDDLLEECNYKYKNLVYNFYKTRHYLIDEIDTSELLRGILTKLYFMINRITEIRQKENFTKQDLIEALELKRDVLYNSVDIMADESYQLRRMEKLLNRFIQEIIMLISEKTKAGFEEVSSRVRAELGEKYKYVEGSAFKSLATAEYLYELLVDVKEPDPKMDYSCISILYYKALEDSLNKLIYKPYYKEYLTLIPEISRWDGRSNIVIDYLPFNSRRCKTEGEAINDIRKNYFKPGKDKGVYIPVDVLTLGSFSYLLNPRNTPKKLQSFLNSVIKDRYNSCSTLSWEILQIKDNRNNAAHGGNIIYIDQVKEDKAHIYTLEEAAKYKKLLLRFLNVLV